MIEKADFIEVFSFAGTAIEIEWISHRQHDDRWKRLSSLSACCAPFLSNTDPASAQSQLFCLQAERFAGNTDIDHGKGGSCHLLAMRLAIESVCRQSTTKRCSCRPAVGRNTHKAFWARVSLQAGSSTMKKRHGWLFSADEPNAPPRHIAATARGKRFFLKAAGAAARTDSELRGKSCCPSSNRLLCQIGSRFVERAEISPFITSCPQLSINAGKMA